MTHILTAGLECVIMCRVFPTNICLGEFKTLLGSVIRLNWMNETVFEIAVRLNIELSLFNFEKNFLVYNSVQLCNDQLFSSYVFFFG